MYRGSVYRCRNIEQDGIDPYRICGDLSAIVGVHLSVGIGDRENPQYKNWQNAGKKENAQNLILYICMQLKAI